MLRPSTRIHALLDYAFALTLMLAPAIFGFGEAGPETVVLILSGMTICFYSFFTAYPGGLYPFFSIKTHLKCDLVLGILIMTSPWIFGFHQDVFKPHLWIGLVFTVIAIFQLKPMMSLNRSTLSKTFAGLNKIQWN